MKDKGYVWITLVAISAAFSYLIISDRGFPYFGLALSLAILSILVYVFKSEKSKFHKALLTLDLLLCACIVFRANPFHNFLNIFSVIFLGSLMALTPKNTSLIGFLHPIFSPFEVFFRSLVTTSEYKFDTQRLKKEDFKIDPQKTSEIIKSLGITAVILIIIIPLLTSANPIFKKLVENFFSYLSLTRLFDFLFSENMFIWFIRLAFAFVLAFFIPRFLTLANHPPSIKYDIQNALSHFHLLIPKIVTALVIAIFFITQAQLYFSSADTLQAMGYTHSQYANEVFGQLTIVAMIIIGLIYNDKNRSQKSKLLTFILVIEGLFLALMAFKSVYDYHHSWGLTHKRLWGYTGIAWIVPVLLLFTYKYYKNLSESFFAKAIIVYSGLTLLTINLLNFDYLIFNYDKSRTSAGTDYSYLANLSPDALAYKPILEHLSKPENISPQENQWILSEVISNIEFLQDKYKTVDLRTFNVAEYNQYLQIKDLNLTPAHESIQNNYQYTPQSSSPPPEQPTTAPTQ